MSMTDGHILFSSALRARGYYPSIDPDRSVTRVGHQTQRSIHKVLADRVRSLIANYHEMERFGRFGSELTAETQKLLKTGMVALELLRQEPLTRIEPNTQILLLSLLFTPFFENKDLEFVKKNKKKIIEFLANSPQIKLIGDKVLTIDLPTLITDLSQVLSNLEAVCQS